MSIQASIAAARNGKVLPVQLAFDYIVHALKTNHSQNLPVSQSGLFKDCRAQGFTRSNVWHVLHSLETMGVVTITPRNLPLSTCVHMQIVWLGGDV